MESCTLVLVHVIRLVPMYGFSVKHISHGGVTKLKPLSDVINHLNWVDDEDPFAAHCDQVKELNDNKQFAW